MRRARPTIRLGNLLFKSAQPELGWEGSFRDKIMAPGVFVWQLWVRAAFCGRELEVYRKGDLTVERVPAKKGFLVPVNV